LSSPVLSFGHDALTVEVRQDSAGAPYLAALAFGGKKIEMEPGQPLVEILTVEDGRFHPSERLGLTSVGRRLRHVSHEVQDGPAGAEARLGMADPESGLEVELRLSSPAGTAALSAVASVRNAGAERRTLLAVTTLSTRIGSGPAEGFDLAAGANDWLGENRWSVRPLRSAAPDLALAVHGGQEARSGFIARSRGTWSTGRDLPAAVLVNEGERFAVAWQVEHNGGWRWEVTEGPGGVALGLSGPTDTDHQWQQILLPGATFTTVPSTIAVGPDLQGAVASLSGYRRAARRTHPDNHKLHVVYNDYMNTLMGDPTTEKLLPLIDGAADAGAEVFCIDAGWYDDGGDWWDSVGEWTPSGRRFPGGLGAVISHIKERGMIPGLWLEPEVIGVRSPMAAALPTEAFLSRDGIRVREAGRYHLDLSHPAARRHVDAVVDRLIGDFAVGFFKLDYNINPGPGTDRDAHSAGEGLLRHNRAHLAWLDSVLDRHPELIIENCGSGAMRMDFALLSRLQLQSTSDQQDPLKYPPIAAAAPMLVLPEQAGNWAYPNEAMDEESIAFNMATGILGRLYLSGHLDRLSEAQRSIVHEAVNVHKNVRPDIAASTPSWPLGLPRWDDPAVALALNSGDDCLVTVWRRPGAPELLDLGFPALAGRTVTVKTLFPANLPEWKTEWDPSAGILHVHSASPAPSARTFRLNFSSTPQ
jgi:alpha-galactosidase